MTNPGSTTTQLQPAESFRPGATGATLPGAQLPWRFPQPRTAIPPRELTHYIYGAQTSKNVEGRQRFVDGVLGPAAALIDPPPERHPEDDIDFVILDDVIDRAECAAFCDAYRSISGLIRRPVSGKSVWDGRTIPAHELIFNFLPLARRVRQLCHYSAEVIRRFYGFDQALYADTAQLVCWPEGIHMKPHADNANAGGQPHGMPWRMFSSILYLNDDYEGGELYLTAQHRIVRPRPGRLVAFTGGFHHEHAVLKIRSGTRYTMAAFFTSDDDRADEFLQG